MPDSEKLYSPEELGFARCREADLYGGDTPEEAAAIFDRVLQGTATPAQSNCVIANAAFAIRVMPVSYTHLLYDFSLRYCEEHGSGV